MMLYRKLGKRIAVAIICLVMLSIMSPALLAAVPHEDPETAKSVFSGVSLLRYYADSLDFVLSQNPAEVESRLENMSFASIPPSLAEATDSFVASSTNISHQVVVIDADLGKLRALVGQFRLGEAKVLAGQISDNLSQAYRELNQIEQATKTTGKELKVSSASTGSDLRRSYDEVVARISRIREMLDLYRDLLAELGLTAERFQPTDITLEIQPRVAFVGDNISFEGVLTFEKRPLAGGEVDILINDSWYITVRTDAYGRYQGVLPVPYWYLPELNWQALYYPRDKDIGLYLASLSPVVKLQVSFYRVELAVTVEGKAYPGRETTISGRFDYGQSPPLNQRRVEIYFDDVFVTEFMAQEMFAQTIRINPEADVGEHIITVFIAAAGRYAPVVASALLNVTRVTTTLDLNLPPIIVIPGGMGLEGRLSSEVGPLSDALAGMGLGGSQVELVSSGEGAFETRKWWWRGWGLIGWQDLVIKVTPKEAGSAPLFFTTRVMVVNVINLGIYLALLAVLGFFLSWRLKKFRVLPKRREARLMVGIYLALLAVLGFFLSWSLKKFRVLLSRRRARPMVGMAPPEPAPAYSDSVSVSASTEEKESDSREPRSRIFYWYRLVVRFLLRIAQISLRPQQTMREFAYEHSGVLGAGAKYFNELTRMVERVFYSPYRPTEQDVENSRQLSLRVEEAAKPEVTMSSFGGEERRVQFESDQFVRRKEGN